MDSQIADNLKKIQDRIRKASEKAGRDSSEILLVAISKTKPNSAILEALDEGQIHFGENRAKELQQKMEEIERDDIIWHFVGPMQTNKIKYMTDRVNWIQSVYKKKYFDEIEKRLDGTSRVINTLIQVNISNEEQKQGCIPEKVPSLLKHAQSLDHVCVRGLMGMATYEARPDEIRNEFRLLKKTFDENLHLNKNSVQMDHISMGMTNDLEIAIEEGSTMVRVGTAIFGERNYN
jgi:PLP dependent protein